MAGDPSSEVPMADHQPARPDDPAEAQAAGLVAHLNRIGPLRYHVGKWPCPRCGEIAAAAEDFHSGLFLEGVHCVRRHPPRRTLRCLIPTCLHVEVVEGPMDRTAGPPPTVPAAEGDAVIPAAVSRLLRPMPPARPDGSTRPARRPHVAEVPRPAASEVDAATAWRRVRSCLQHLLEALADLDEAGGLAAVADAHGWKRRRWAKHLGLLGLVQRMLADAMHRGRDERRRD